MCVCVCACVRAGVCSHIFYVCIYLLPALLPIPLSPLIFSYLSLVLATSLTILHFPQRLLSFYLSSSLPSASSPLFRRPGGFLHFTIPVDMPCKLPRRLFPKPSHLSAAEEGGRRLLGSGVDARRSNETRTN